MTIAGNCQRIRKKFRIVADAFCVMVVMLGLGDRSVANETIAAAHFHESAEPILEKYCFACHAYGERKGGHAFDEFKSDKALVGDTKLWLAVLKNVRAGLMPPHCEERPTAEEQ